MTNPILRIIGLEATYGAIRALHTIDMDIAAGGITAVLGANGAGKTTLLRSISALVKTRGKIEFNGERIDSLPTEAIARRGIAHVPDGRGTLTHLTVDENLQVGAYLCRDPREAAASYERVFSYFPRLRERRRQQAGTLSGGEQQMLAIGRALMQRPRLLLMDEPSFGLAPLVINEIFSIMKRINSEERVSILLVEQNAEQALSLAQEAVLLESGRKVLSGPCEILRRDDRVRRSYLGH